MNVNCSIGMMITLAIINVDGDLVGERIVTVLYLADKQMNAHTLEINILSFCSEPAERLA